MQKEFLRKNKQLVGKARDYLKEGGDPSVTAFQRKFYIGFARACMLLDSLVEIGVVVEMPTGGVPKREVIKEKLPLLDEYL